MDMEHRIVDLPHGDRRWCVVGPRMGVDFHFSKLNGYDVCAGLECHYKQCPSYMKDSEPFSQDCWLTHQVCWGDGTSLYATEYLYPLFESIGEDNFWAILEEELRKRDEDAFGDNP